ncbi:MAG TPA: lytic transglycosylase domain-containing protein [Vicinamibacterales bacterium]
MKALFFLIALAIAAPASAELIFFSAHRSMSVAGHRFEGDRVIVSLRGGGEMSFDRALIAKIEPDEVPYFEDETAQAQETAVPVANSSGLAGTTAYDPMIETAATKHDVDARIVKAVIQVESAFQPRARSPKGAMGLMQLMPTTARRYAARNPYDPASNIDAGTRYLKGLLAEFELPLALAAYNAGEGAVRRFGGIPPYAETQAYVTKVLGLLR